MEKIASLDKILGKVSERFEPLIVVLAYCGAVAYATGKGEIGKKILELAEKHKVEPIIVNTDKIYFITMGDSHISIYTDKYLIEVDLNTGKVKHFIA